jgi:hypothetical protein
MNLIALKDIPDSVGGIYAGKFFSTNEKHGEDLIADGSAKLADGAVEAAPPADAPPPPAPAPEALTPTPADVQPMTTAAAEPVVPAKKKATA